MTQINNTNSLACWNHNVLRTASKWTGYFVMFFYSIKLLFKGIAGKISDVNNTTTTTTTNNNFFMFYEWNISVIINKGLI